jgi:flagellar biosynthesis chaperone FliJ
VASASLEKLREKVEYALERFAAVQRENNRLEKLAEKHETEARDLKKRLEHAAHERTILRQRLIKVMEHIDSLNVF